MRELEQMVVHVRYEVIHLKLWDDVRKGEHARELVPLTELMVLAVDRAMAEALLLHMRNVEAFLMKKRSQYPDEVLAEHYFDDGWTTRPEQILGTAAMKEIHQRAAHISVKRLKPFTWHAVLDLAPTVLKGFYGFHRDLAKLHPDRAEWFMAESDIGIVLPSPFEAPE